MAPKLAKMTKKENQHDMAAAWPKYLQRSENQHQKISGEEKRHRRSRQPRETEIIGIKAAAAIMETSSAQK